MHDMPFLWVVSTLLEMRRRVDLFSKLQSGWESLSEEKKASYRTHFSICGVCVLASCYP